MVDVPAELVLASTLCIGTIYKFSAPELIDINIPHYFIVVAIEDDNNYMVVCTTQLDNKIKYFDNLGLDFNGLVYIKPDNTNGLTKDSYVNCNQYHTITRQELIIKIESEVFECTGGISLGHYMQIKTGIVESHINDLPEYLLIHPDE